MGKVSIDLYRLLIFDIEDFSYVKFVLNFLFKKYLMIFIKWREKLFY